MYSKHGDKHGRKPHTVRQSLKAKASIAPPACSCRCATSSSTSGRTEQAAASRTTSRCGRGMYSPSKNSEKSLSKYSHSQYSARYMRYILAEGLKHGAELRAGHLDLQEGVAQRQDARHRARRAAQPPPAPLLQRAW